MYQCIVVYGCRGGYVPMHRDVWVQGGYRGPWVRGIRLATVFGKLKRPVLGSVQFVWVRIGSGVRYHLQLLPLLIF